MQDTKEIKEAVNWVKKGMREGWLKEDEIEKYKNSQKLLLNLAQSHLTALESVVEKKVVNSNPDFMQDDPGEARWKVGFNSCHDLLTPRIVQLREEVKLLEAQIDAMPSKGLLTWLLT
jgi:hypothetical protein